MVVRKLLQRSPKAHRTFLCGLQHTQSGPSHFSRTSEHRAAQRIHQASGFHATLRSDRHVPQSYESSRCRFHTSSKQELQSSFCTGNYTSFVSPEGHTGIAHHRCYRSRTEPCRTWRRTNGDQRSTLSGQQAGTPGHRHRTSTTSCQQRSACSTAVSARQPLSTCTGTSQQPNPPDAQETNCSAKEAHRR